MAPMECTKNSGGVNSTSVLGYRCGGSQRLIPGLLAGMDIPSEELQALCRLLTGFCIQPFGLTADPRSQSILQLSASANFK